MRDPPDCCQSRRGASAALALSRPMSTMIRNANCVPAIVCLRRVVERSSRFISRPRASDKGIHLRKVRKRAMENLFEGRIETYRLDRYELVESYPAQRQQLL